MNENSFETMATMSRLLTGFSEESKPELLLKIIINTTFSIVVLCYFFSDVTGWLDGGILGDRRRN